MGRADLLPVAGILGYKPTAQSFTEDIEVQSKIPATKKKKDNCCMETLAMLCIFKEQQTSSSAHSFVLSCLLLPVPKGLECLAG